eukprot:TRINITY_DN2867_c0_g1_i1.p3 TRINITY_DN2867_c0_g1~~TRINITY_DN2867_c0_g1_i1.p3  ORF type:complete len:103 (+),score=20.60 TRINITY_DN2867_c0_g1_i1:301-609(+)
MPHQQEGPWYKVLPQQPCNSARPASYRFATRLLGQRAPGKKSSHSTVSAQAQAASPTQWQEEHPRRRKYANRFIEFSLELEQGSSPLSAERLCKLRYRNRDQ